MGGTPIGTSNPPCWGDCTPCPSQGRQWGTRVPWSPWRHRFPDTSSEMPCSPGRRAMLESFLTAYGPRRSLPTSSSSVGTHSVGSPRNLGFWLFRKNTAFSRRSRPWRQGSPLQWYSQPGKPKYHLKKSFGPWQEKGAYAPRELDTFILGIVRYQVGCSARFNDLQHTAPSTLKHTTTTLEFSAWQTKTVSAARIRKHPVPLICPKYSFTGHAWWQPLLTWWTRLSKHPSFEESDYLIPTISKDGMGFIARPGQADRTLRWLKDALGRRGVPPELFQDLTWHSFRVFIPDCAFQLGISRDQRRYLGNWMTESTADVYTREKRNVVVKVWHEVANNLSEEDLSHADWEGLPLAEPSPAKKSVKDSLFSESMEEDFTVISPPKDQSPPVLEEDDAGEIQEVPPLPEEQDSTIPSKTPADKLGPPHGPLRVVASSRKSGPTGTYKIHLLTVDHRQWDVDGSPPHWKRKISIPFTMSPILVVTKSVWDVLRFLIFPRIGLSNRQPKKKILRSHHLRRTVSLMTQ